MFELIKASNPIVSKSIGEIDQFSYDGKTICFDGFRTSRVLEIIRDEDMLIVTTRNSKYEFKEVYRRQRR